jgi:hypothetical protein
LNRATSIHDIAKVVPAKRARAAFEPHDILALTQQLSDARKAVKADAIAKAGSAVNALAKQGDAAQVGGGGGRGKSRGSGAGGGRIQVPPLADEFGG